jgi:hypothetical protein
MEGLAGETAMEVSSLGVFKKLDGNPADDR